MADVVDIASEVAALRDIIDLSDDPREVEQKKAELRALLGGMSPIEAYSRGLSREKPGEVPATAFAAGQVSRPTTVARYAAGELTKQQRDRRLSPPDESRFATFETDPEAVPGLAGESADEVMQGARRGVAEEEPLGAAAMGALDSASFGLARHAMEPIYRLSDLPVRKDDFEALRSANPNAAAAGEVAGHLLPGFYAGKGASLATTKALAGRGLAKDTLPVLARLGLAGAEGLVGGALYSGAQAAGHGQGAEGTAQAVSDAVTDPYQLAMNVGMPMAFQGLAEVPRAIARRARRPGNVYNSINENRALETPEMSEKPGWNVEGDEGTTQVAQDELEQVADKFFDEAVDMKADAHTADMAINDLDSDLGAVPSPGMHGRVEAAIPKSQGSDGTVPISPDATGAVARFKKMTTGTVPGQPEGVPKGVKTKDPSTLRMRQVAVEGDVLASPLRPVIDPKTGMPKIVGHVASGKLVPPTFDHGVRVKDNRPLSARANIDPLTGGPRVRVDPAAAGPPPTRPVDNRLVNDTAMEVKTLDYLRKYPESGSPGAVERLSKTVDDLKARMTPEELQELDLRTRVSDEQRAAGAAPASIEEAVSPRAKAEDNYPRKVFEKTESEVVGKAMFPKGDPYPHMDDVTLWQVRFKKGPKVALNDLRAFATQLGREFNDPNIASSQKANTRALYAAVLDEIKRFPETVKAAKMPKDGGTQLVDPLAETQLGSPTSIEDAMLARRRATDAVNKAQEAVDLDTARREDFSRRATKSAIEQRLAFRKPLSKFRGEDKSLVEGLGDEVADIETPEQMAAVESDLDGTPTDFNPDVDRRFDREAFREQAGEFWSKAGVPGRLFAKYNNRLSELVRRRPDLAPMINTIKAKTAKELSKFALSGKQIVGTNSASLGRGMVAHNFDWLMIHGTKKDGGWFDKVVDILEATGQRGKFPAAEFAKKKERK
jgi:hypothetical protein